MELTMLYGNVESHRQGGWQPDLIVAAERHALLLPEDHQSSDKIDVDVDMYSSRKKDIPGQIVAIQ